jgi:hypothetical protein
VLDLDPARLAIDVKFKLVSQRRVLLSLVASNGRCLACQAFAG